jgi:hypothetical protein
MSDRVTLECVGSYPIPVGHRVEVRMFEAPGGLLQSAQSRPQEPSILDRDTGVVYGHAWHYAKLSSALTPWQTQPLSPEVRADLREVWRATGVVDACRVVWVTMGSVGFPQTTLVLRSA